jgi:hypothetical protein
MRRILMISTSCSTENPFGMTARTERLFTEYCRDRILPAAAYMSKEGSAPFEKDGIRYYPLDVNMSFGAGQAEWETAKQALLRVIGEFGPDVIHSLHAAQQGGLVAVRIGTRDPEADPRAVAIGEETLEVGVRSHHIVAGRHHRFKLFDRVHLPPDPQAGTALHPGRLIGFSAEAE